MLQAKKLFQHVVKIPHAFEIM